MGFGSHNCGFSGGWMSTSEYHEQNHSTHSLHSSPITITYTPQSLQLQYTPDTIVCPVCLDTLIKTAFSVDCKTCSQCKTCKSELNRDNGTCRKCYERTLTLAEHLQLCDLGTLRKLCVQKGVGGNVTYRGKKSLLSLLTKIVTADDLSD
jgi:hypothetical protein